MTAFSQDEVVFHFGSFYAGAYPKFSLSPGAKVVVGVNGATFVATVRYAY